MIHASDIKVEVLFRAIGERKRYKRHTDWKKKWKLLYFSNDTILPIFIKYRKSFKIHTKEEKKESDNGRRKSMFQSELHLSAVLQQGKLKTKLIMWLEFT